MSINKKIIVFSLSGLLLMGVISLVMSIHSLGKRGEQEIATVKTMMMTEKQEKLNNIVDITFNTIGSIYNRSDLTEDQKKQSALDLVKDMRYDKKGYFWINDMNPRMVMHPIKPALNGNDLSGFKDPNGKYLFNAVISASGTLICKSTNTSCAFVVIVPCAKALNSSVTNFTVCNVMVCISFTLVQLISPDKA